MDEEKIFYQNWLNVVSQRAEGYIYDEKRNLLPTQDIFSKIWILPGIRGTGKTTLLMQLYKTERFLKPDDQNILKNAVNLFYDISEGGADFILALRQSKIIIGVGFNKEEIRQVMNTQNKVKGKYGLVFGKVGVS